ncbi:unnamed protein product [Dicrocoelium dendriticum]|nr:unnamed protein product [Dicrocoelium dendriticum]
MVKCDWNCHRSPPELKLIGFTSNIMCSPITATRATLQKRIFGGTKLSTFQYTWLVRITKSEPDPRTCTGVLIHSTLVLTTASCLGTNVDELIRLNSSLEHRVFKVETGIPQDDYLMENTSHSGNLAILKLENPVKLKDIPLDYGKVRCNTLSSVLGPVEDDIGLYIGWPKDVSKYGLVKPEWTHLIVLSNASCTQAIGPEYDHQSQFCGSKLSSSKTTLDTVSMLLCCVSF